MELPDINKKIYDLVRTHETRNPFRIARELGVIVLFENLGDIYGYYSKHKRIKFIHINENLTEDDKLVTCAHELAHSICHPNENTPFLSKSTIVSELKIEKEANYFATRLIVDGTHNDIELISKFEILDYYGLPESFERFL
ncbi:ImmA/IrrE family metallo-endopeptidase [Enterococcus gallinarum]|uniref:ImmA/IrrE family metallo-endopeptidase n=1 Tax=Enterococcus gallinarum TaxID=1353 RepID=UPI001559B8D5|nr:ImmA/IrrE family metallo-endopeptidase [Enterococcus gallinarum]NQE01814.1 ImmA/IrrE family metallo-endopeptidase [Enterococcus gallinarum]